MKKIYTPSSFLLLMLLSSTCFSQGIWTWMSGATVANGPAVFGTQGVPSVNNHPQGDYSPYCWTDKQGNFWLYGGSNTSITSNGDLWEFNPSTLEWTWVKGNGSATAPAVYGTQGIANIANTPGYRYWSGCTWVDTSGNLWLFGGNGTAGMLSDMWMYNIASNEWTWESGSQAGGINPVYGTLGVPSASNTPGARVEVGSSWVDTNGKFWYYGGNAVMPGLTCRSDMWMYDPVTNMWTWESGPQTVEALPVYGTKGVFSATNTPGARRPASMWVDANGKFFVFGGGDGNYIAGKEGLYADLWEYDPSINQWAWISGSKTNLATGVAGASCQSDTSYFPDARMENKALWTDCAGNAWMFGGNVASGVNLGDMWVYLKATNSWARTTSTNNSNANPVFGTMGVPSASNLPGARQGMGHWQDSKGNFWMFGGDAGSTGQSLSDMWMYTRDSNCVKVSCGGCLSYAGVISSSHDSICAQSGVTSLLSTNNTTGSLQWQSSIDGINFSNITGANTGSYTTPTSLSQSTYYRLIANGGTCADTSQAQKITVLPSALAGVISALHDTICSNTVGRLKVSGSSGSIQWQSSATGSNYQNISSATDSTYNQLLFLTTHYRIISVNGICSDTSASFTLTVVPSPVAAFTSSDSGLVVKFNSSGSTGNITGYTWAFGDGTTSTQANPVHVYSKADTFHVCLTVNNNTNCNYTICENIEVYGTGVTNVSAATDWNIYPDPFTQELNIVSTGSIPASSIEIYNVLGQMVLARNIAGAQNNIYKINTSGLANGVYFIRISTRDSDFTVPVVKQ